MQKSSIFLHALSATKNLIRTAHAQTTYHKHHPTVLLGLSGGPDSVFLFYVLLELAKKKEINMHAAHINHGWRDSAQDDERFCQKLCEHYNIPLHMHTATNMPTYNGSYEEQGRVLRRTFFQTMAHEINASTIALAHHRQDHLETFFIRLLRGACLSGLTGIQAINLPYIRPLLAINKNDIIDLLQQHNHAYCIDPTNETMNYLRNRIRHQLFPVLKAIDHRSEQKIESTMNNLHEEENYLQEQAHALYLSIQHKKTSQQTHGPILLRNTFLQLHPVMQRRVLLMWLIDQQRFFTPSTKKLAEIVRFITSPQGGRHVVSPWIIRKKENKIWIE